MRRGWEVELKDGTFMNEDSYQWKDIPKAKIKKLTLHYDGRRWDMEGKEAYFIRTSASCAPGFPESFQVERRCVGYYEGSDKVCYIINEWTGELKIKVE